MSDYGVHFPLSNGKRPSSGFAQSVLEVIQKSLGENYVPIADKRAWRWGYMPKVVSTVVALCRADRKRVEAAAADALLHARNTLRFVRADGYETSLATAMDCAADARRFATHVVEGKAARRSPRDLAVRYAPRLRDGTPYSGEALEKLVGEWAGRGVIDRSAVRSVKFFNTLQTLDLSNKCFVMLGATSEMGPLAHLLDYGADVMAIARPDSKRKQKWAKLCANATASAGRLLAPKREDGTMGADLLTEAPRIAAWVAENAPKGKDIVLCPYAYMDGALFVRVSAAMDAIIEYVAEKRPGRVAIAYIETPAHAQAVPRECQLVSERCRRAAPFYQKALAALGILKPNKYTVLGGGGADTEGKAGPAGAVVDALSAVQGPNYAIAKLLQRLCAVRHRLSRGGLVSATVGPGTATWSVLHNPRVARASKQMYRFAPNDFYRVETVKPLLFMMLVADLYDPASLARPQTAEAAAAAPRRPFDFLAENAWHSGMWTSAYLGRSLGMPAYFMHYVERYTVPVLVGCALAGAGLAYYLLR